MKRTNEITEVKLFAHMGDDGSLVKINQSSIQYRNLTRTEIKPAVFRMVRHGHWSALQQTAVTVEVHCPIFVARQWMRHEQAFNELSLRYDEIPEDHDFALPEWKSQDQINKQGSLEPLPEETSDLLDGIYTHAVLASLTAYRGLLKGGASREQARQSLPVSTYTRFYATANLRNWLFFCRARMDKHAQDEIRFPARQVWEILRNLFPLATEAFGRYVLRATTLHTGMASALVTALNNLGVHTKDLLAEIASADHHFINPSEKREALEAFKELLSS